MAQVRIVRLEFRLDEFVAIQIDEPDPAMRKVIAEARLMQKQLRIAMVTRSFTGNAVDRTNRYE